MLFALSIKKKYIYKRSKNKLGQIFAFNKFIILRKKNKTTLKQMPFKFAFLSISK